jgi:hypothetical protein
MVLPPPPLLRSPQPYLTTSNPFSPPPPLAYLIPHLILHINILNLTIPSSFLNPSPQAYQIQIPPLSLIPPQTLMKSTLLSRK